MTQERAGDPAPRHASIRRLGADRLPAALALVALVLIAYWPATQAGFIWDDDANITQNLPLRSLAGLRALWTTPGTTTQYYPLVYTSFWLEYAGWGLRPFVYHFDNLLLHGLASVLLWRCLVALGVRGAWLAAAVFALHPLQVETVAWATERKNLLSLVFMLGAAYAYLGAGEPDRAQSAPATGAARWRGEVLSVVLFVAAILSKVTAIVLPPALLVIVWWRRGALRARDLAVTGAMLAIAIPVGLLTRSLESGLGETLGFEWSPTPVMRILQATRAVWHYMVKLVWPSDLTFIYPRWEIDPRDPAAYLYGVALLALAAALFAARRRIGRAPLAALMLFVGGLAPVLGFLEVYFFRFSYVADHWIYVACIAPIALGIAAASMLLDRVATPLGLRVALSAALLVGLGASSWQYSHVFRSSESLWRDSLSKNPDAFIARYNLGAELQRRARPTDALEQYRAAVALDPTSPHPLVNIGLIQLESGDPASAIASLERAHALDPDSPRLRWNLGLALERAGDFERAQPHLEFALRNVDPVPGESQRLLDGHRKLATLYRARGLFAAAAVHERAASEIEARAREGFGSH